MRFLSKIALICLLTATLFLTGCTGAGSTNVYTSPPEKFSLEDAGKIDLKMVDMGKLTKSKIDNVSGVSLNKLGEGYDIKYRYLNNNITVKIVKFYSSVKGDKFWSKWIENGSYKTQKINGASIVSLQTKRYSVRAWQKGSWFTYIGVPTNIANHKQLLEQIRKYINYQYKEL